MPDEEAAALDVPVDRALETRAAIAATWTARRDSRPLMELVPPRGGIVSRGSRVFGGAQGEAGAPFSGTMPPLGGTSA